MERERIVAKVTDVMTTNFAEVSVIEDYDLIADDPLTELNNGSFQDATSGFDFPGKEKGERFIAQFDKKKFNVRRGDIVEIIPIEARIMNEAKIAYIGPVILFVIGFLISNKLAMGERILSGAILAVMGFVISWLMNRRSRMLRRQEYKVVRIIKEDPNHI